MAASAPAREPVHSSFARCEASTQRHGKRTLLRVVEVHSAPGGGSSYDVEAHQRMGEPWGRRLFARLSAPLHKPCRSAGPLYRHPHLQSPLPPESVGGTSSASDDTSRKQASASLFALMPTRPKATAYLATARTSAVAAYGVLGQCAFVQLCARMGGRSNL